MRPTFGERLKELRLEHKLTQLELAKKLFISKSSICKYEKDNNFPEASLLQKIADYFEVSVDYLLGKSNIKSNNDNKIKDELIQQKLREILECFIEAGYDPNKISKEEFKLVIDTYMNLKGIKKD